MSDSATSETVTHQAPLSMGFSKQAHWSGLPFPSPRHPPNPGIKPRSPALQADSLPSQPPGKPMTVWESRSKSQWGRAGGSASVKQTMCWNWPHGSGTQERSCPGDGGWGASLNIPGLKPRAGVRAVTEKMEERPRTKLKWNLNRGVA